MQSDLVFQKLQQKNMKIQTLIITFLLLGCSQALKVSDFQPSLFKFTSIQEGFRNIQTGQNRIGQVMAFIDLNGDRFTDYVALQTRDTSQLLFYIWDNQRQQFIQFKRYLDIQTPFHIQEIIVYDLNQNGSNQLIITTNQNGKYTTRLFEVNCIQCDEKIGLLQSSQIKNISAVPFLLDSEGNGVAKLFIYKDDQRLLYFYNMSSKSYLIKQFKQILNNYNEFPFNPIQKHFASLIDLNNDCFADLMLISYQKLANVTIYYIELYQKQSNNNYMLKLTVDLQDDFQGKVVQNPGNQQQSSKKVQAKAPLQIDSLQMVTFNDIDNSGSVDLIFFYKYAGKYYIKALLNSFVPEQICRATYRGIFPYVDFDFFQLPDLQLPTNYELTESSVPHFNDVNADGLPDILMIMQSNGYDKVVILINKGNLKFQKYDDQWKAYELNNPSQTLFYDYGEDGKIDLMILSQQKKTANGTTTTSSTRTSIINNLQSDTLHLKILPLSITSQYNQDQKKISNTFGVTTQWLFTDIDGHKLVKTSNQKFQFNYGLMQLPYAYSGLGRTNNYVEQLTVGYQKFGQKKDWTPIIPNSQLMVYKQRGNWRLQTLLKNSQRVNDVIYVAVLILLCMGAVIFYLNYKQVQQDKRDHYTFIQLIR